MISIDQSSNPLGSNNALEEDERQGKEEGERAMNTSDIRYQRAQMIAKGEPIVKTQGSTLLVITSSLLLTPLLSMALSSHLFYMQLCSALLCSALYSATCSRAI